MKWIYPAPSVFDPAQHLRIPAAILKLILISFIFGFCVSCGGSRPADKESSLIFEDATRHSGLARYSESFGAVFSDIDNDGDDDLIVSNHGLFTPSLFLNENGTFEDHSSLFRLGISRDWHGITVADMDNDGDRDIAIAGGGGGGTQGGAPNLLFKNLLAETGGLAFMEMATDAGIVNQRWRGRHFLPVASFDGTAVELYFVCRPREEITNLYFRNASTAEEIFLKADASPGLEIQLRQEGRGDCFFDFDRDGDRDLFVLDNGHLLVFENKSSHFYRNDALVPETAQIETLAVGDLNRDGFPDLYLGSRAKNSGSDRVTFGSAGDENKIHFYVTSRSGTKMIDKSDRVDFKCSDSEIHIDFIREPGLSVDDPSDIFLGRNNSNPASRAVRVPAETASGEPAVSDPGTYLWNDGSGHWTILWLYENPDVEERGIITANNLEGVEPEMLESFPRQTIADRIFLNQRGLGFQDFDALDLSHEQKTRAVAIEDFNNDGWPDIVGIRGDEPGALNGRPFIFLSRGRLFFEPVAADSIDTQEDDIGQADQMAVGFVNGDGLPDLFITNGFGLIPGNRGPYKLFINQTNTKNGYVLLELQGKTSNRDALGAQVALYAKDGTLLGYRELGAGYSTMQNSHKQHFGLGSYRGRIIAKILWPSGFEQTVSVQPDKINVIVEETVH